MNSKLTKKQMLILDFIKNFILENDISPSYREIASALSLSSVASVSEHVDNLIEKGFIRKNPGTARSLEVVETENLETINLFKEKINLSTPEEKKILEKAAKILQINIS